MSDEEEPLEIIDDAPNRLDVVCTRTPPNRMTPGSVVKVSIPQYVVQHSPAGFEWGYSGAGPHDLALNILHMHVPPGADGKPPVKLYRGWCSQVAWDLHGAFCAAFIAPMLDAGGVIRAADVAAWIAARWSRDAGHADSRYRFRTRPGEDPEADYPGG